MTKKAFFTSTRIGAGAKLTFLLLILLFTVLLLVDPAHASQAGLPGAVSFADSAGQGNFAAFAFTQSNVSGCTFGSNVGIATTTSTITLDNITGWVSATARYIPTQKGNYLFSVTACGYGTSTTTSISAYLYKNGSPVAGTGSFIQATLTISVATCTTSAAIVSMNGTSDYLQFLGAIGGSGTCNSSGSGYAIRISN